MSAGWNYPTPCSRCGIMRRRRSSDQEMCAACRQIPSMNMPQWTDWASCKDPNFDPNWWWPEKTDDPLAPVAIAICRSCKVRDLCLDYAIEHREVHGIWGGTLPANRAAITARRRRDAI